MKGSRHVDAFWELDVYREAFDTAKVIYDLTKRFPAEERYSLVSQVRKSSRSVGAQIAEAWGKRRYRRHFVSKLTDADAEQLETQHWMRTALSCRLVTEGEASTVIEALSRIGRRLHSMIERADDFCGPDEPIIRDPSASYHRSPNTDCRSPITVHRSPITDDPYLEKEHNA